MRLTIYSLFCSLILIFSTPASASLSLFDNNQPTLTPAATQINTAINQLPDQHLFTSQDVRKVNTLLSKTLAQQEKHRELLAEALTAYHNSDNKEQAWKKLSSVYSSLLSISQDKERLLDLSSSAIQDKVTGFGPFGVQQFKLELSITALNLQYMALYQLRSFQGLLQDMWISPVPVLMVALKVCGILFLLFWWQRNSTRLIEHFRETQLESNPHPNLIFRAIWYISRAHRPIGWLIAITLSLRIVSQLPSLHHLIYLEIFTWWILGGSIAVRFILEFARRNSINNSDTEVVALRLSTIRQYVWGFIAAGVILQISARTLGQGTIYAWIWSVIFFGFILLTLVTLRRWRHIVFKRLEDVPHMPISIKWAVNHKDKFLLSIPATALGAVWLTLRRFQHTLVANLSKYIFFRHALAYLFRIEVAKQTETAREQLNMVRIKGTATYDYVTPGSDDSPIIEDYALDEIKQLSGYVLTDKPAVCVVSGERGIGTTTLLRRLLHKVKNATPIYINCPYDGYSELLQQLASELGLAADSDEATILDFLRNSEETYLFAIDNAQRLVTPKVGGLNDLMKITDLMRRSRKSHRALFAIEKSCWRFVDRARGERLLFDLVTFMPRWSEQQIGDLLKTRFSSEGEYAISFEGLVLPRQWDEDDITEEERAQRGFFRILWDYSDGNPTVAVRFFRFSLQRDKDTDKVLVRLFKAPQSDDLEQMPKPMLAVLRSIVQLEVASPKELSECTQLSISEVIGTLRYFQSRGFIEWSDDKAKVSDHWFRHITNVLHRQHLLVK
ncbi:AAA family ATPase [Photobacterium leiognathi subsp. mandapamensis]|nr:AAA family ATPase [Photobacterium leiognathi subsp. mandapamensis]